MSKVTSVLPRIGYITKEGLKMFWKGARVYPLDAFLCVFTLAMIIWFIFADIWLEGAAAILFAYTYLNVIRLYTLRSKIVELSKLVDPTNVS